MVARRLRLDSRWIVFLIVLNLVIGFVVPGIAWQAHVGGLLAGGLLTAAYAYAPRNKRALMQVGATVAVVAVLVIAVRITRNHQTQLASYRACQPAGLASATSWTAHARDDQGEPDGEVPAASACMGRVPPVM